MICIICITWSKFGLSDFHKLTFTVLRRYFKKPKPKTFVNRDYKTSLMRDFLSETEKYLGKYGFSFAFTCVLDKHA